MTFNKFSQLNPKGNVWRAVWRICMWISGLKGLILTLYATSFPVERKVSRTEWLIEISNSKNMLSRRLARNSATCKCKKFTFLNRSYLYMEEGYSDQSNGVTTISWTLQNIWVFKISDVPLEDQVGFPSGWSVSVSLAIPLLKKIVIDSPKNKQMHSGAF